MNSQPDLNDIGVSLYSVDAPVHPAVADLLGRDPARPDAVDTFVAANSFPLTEPRSVTFAWRGPAERVELLRWIHGGVDRGVFEHVEGTDLWLLRLPVEDEGRFEYKLAVWIDGNENWVLDPLNPARAGDPFGENSVCRTYGYERPEWSRPAGAPGGQYVTVEIESAAFGQVREERVYLPANHDPTAPHALLIIHDGEDYMTYADLGTSLDNLIHAGDIPPVIAVLLQTNDRMGEYTGGRRHARYLVHDLLPRLSGIFNITEVPSRRVLLGASLGAVASLSTAFRYPGVFSGLVLKSGSFIFDERKLEGRQHPVFQRIAHLVQAFRRAPDLPPSRAFVSTGELEGLADQNREMASFLREHGVDVLFKSAWDGHHWHNWRNQLRDGLMWVLPDDAKE